jgi:hypothetical protein
MAVTLHAEQGGYPEEAFSLVPQSDLSGVPNSGIRVIIFRYPTELLRHYSSHNQVQVPYTHPGDGARLEKRKAMKYIQNFAILAFSMLLAGLAPPALAKDPHASPGVNLHYNGNWPSDEEAQQLRDELFYNNAIQAYMTMLPALNTIGLRDGSQKEFGAGYNIIPMWKDRMDAKAWLPTPNADIMYAMAYFDLKETGPLVVAAPPKVIGMFTDFFQRTLVDVGNAGPDRGRGGLYLLLPPNYQGPVPDGYFSYTSSTYNVFLFFRMVMPGGENGLITGPAVEVGERTRVYPLWAEEKNIKPMEFPNGSGRRINMQYPVDYTYWTKLKKFVDHEPFGAITPELRGVLAAIGIIKGKPFKPTARQKKLLEKAVLMTPKMILAQRKVNRPDKRNLYYKDRQWFRIWSGATAEWMQESYLDSSARTAFFQIGYSSAPAMVMRYINNGSKYPAAIRDADGDILNGSNNYKLHLPAGIPAKLFWAVTIYNITDGTMPETSQAFPGVNGYDNLVKNKDGSIDLYFGPSKPEDAPEANWIQTIDGRDWLVGLRIYGSGVEFFDQSWKPDDLVKLKR